MHLLEIYSCAYAKFKEKVGTFTFREEQGCLLIAASIEELILKYNKGKGRRVGYCRGDLKLSFFPRGLSQLQTDEPQKIGTLYFLLCCVLWEKSKSVLLVTSEDGGYEINCYCAI